MSTIVAVEKNGRICIAADSLTTFGDVRQTSAYDSSSEKILPFKDGFIGIVGSAAHHVVMQEVLSKESDKIQLDSREKIYTSFLHLHPVLKQKYFLNPKEDDEDSYESSRIDALIVNPSGIYGVYSLREVFTYNKFWAIGAGAEIALGALYAAYGHLDDVEQIVTLAIEASAEFHTSTALPLSMYTVDSAKP